MLVHFSEKQFILRNVCINLLPQWSADDCLMLHLDWKDQWGDDKSNNHVDNRYKTSVRFPYFNFFFFFVRVFQCGSCKTAIVCGMNL